MENPNEFLAASDIVDFHSAEVRALSERLSAGIDSDDAPSYIARCFEWVKNEVKHSADCGDPRVTCAASDVARAQVGFCYAKSHLLVALLRARQVPAAFCYQRLANDDGTFCLHGLVSVHLGETGWYRIDPRGGPRGAMAAFAPPVERLVYTPCATGEFDLPTRFRDPLPNVIETLRRFRIAADVLTHLPDVPESMSAAGPAPQ